MQFDQADIAAAVGASGVASAKLRLWISGNGNHWGAIGQTVGAYRSTSGWAEPGATWHCPNDTNPSNSSPDCGPVWDMDNYPNWPFQQTPTGTALLTNDQSGWVEWDVTADVTQFLAGSSTNFGWLIRKTDEGQTGAVDYSSREGAVAPQLVLVAGTPPPPSPSLTSIADTYLRSGQANQNQGYETILRVQDSGNNRALFRIDQAAIAAFVGPGSLQSAKVRLYITDNGNNWGPAGRTVSVHRLTADWAEQEATWNCPNDTNPVNSSKDCNPDWNMTQSAQWPFVSSPTASLPITSNQAGWVEWDVTADVAAFLAGSSSNYGWIVKKDLEGQAGRVDFSSREGSFKPELSLVVSAP